MGDTEQIRQQVQSPAPFSTWFGVVLLMVLFWVIAVAIIGPAPRGDTYEQQRAQNREKKLKDLRDEDAKALTGYAWIDKTKGSVRIPIERAMQIAITDLANKKPTAAGPIASPAAEASAAPTAGGSASPTPSASPHANGTPKATTSEGPSSESRGQPAAAINPPSVKPGTQPGANSAAPASSKGPAAAPAASPNASPVHSATPAPSQ
jgi:hypothetical protein